MKGETKVRGIDAERATGLEPATSSLGSWHSTTELRPRISRKCEEEAWRGQGLRTCRFPVLPVLSVLPVLFRRRGFQKTPQIWLTDRGFPRGHVIQAALAHPLL